MYLCKASVFLRQYFRVSGSACDKNWYSRWCYITSEPGLAGRSEPGYKCSILCTNFRFLTPGGPVLLLAAHHSTIGIETHLGLGTPSANNHLAPYSSSAPTTIFHKTLMSFNSSQTTRRTLKLTGDWFPSIRRINLQIIGIATIRKLIDYKTISVPTNNSQ